MKKFSLFVLSCLLSISGFSTHIVGGEIYYDYLGNNNYKITLKVYRDCFNGQAPFDNPASIGVYDMSGVLKNHLLVTHNGVNQVPFSLNPCIVPPMNVCVEEAIYDTIVNLPPIAGGYDLVYQRCCRNGTILNLVNPGNVGSTYFAHIPDGNQISANSSPRFNNYPPVFICAGQPLNFDHSATDPDGDVLVYEFADPWDGASSTYPMPQPPASSPYFAVPWVSPYNTNYQMASSPAMAVNATTGMLTGTPTQIGQWVVGVRVKEYRNNQLISINLRDFQFNVVNCPPIPVSSIPSQTVFCTGMTVNFQNASIGGNTYHWNFGDTAITNDTSNVFAPTWTYSTPGTYSVMLVVNPYTPCADTAYTAFQVYPLLNPSFTAPAAQCFQGHSFNFNATGAFGGAPGPTTISWVFGPNANPPAASTATVNNVTFNAPGTYAVTLTISENGCTKTIVDSVTVLDQPVLTYNPPPVAGCAPLAVSFSDSSFNDPSIVTVIWNFGDGNISMQNNPVHVYAQPGVYNVSVSFVTNNPCLSNQTFTINAMVTVHPSPLAGMTATPTTITIFDPTVYFTDLSSGSSNCWVYFGDGQSVNSCGSISHTYQQSGTYVVSQTVENQYGCRDSMTLIIDADFSAAIWIPNAFTPNFDGKNEFFGPIATGVQNAKFMIFDRWGNKIFETNDLSKGWDGTLNGTRCQEDVYVWKLIYEHAGENNTSFTKVGHVSLIK